MGGYLTDQRKVLQKIFKDNLHESFSAKQLENLLRARGISKSAIYRNLASMEKDGVLCRVTNNNGREALYRYVDPSCCAGVVHLTCDKCRVTYHLNRHVSDMISGLAMENFGFTVSRERAVIFGLCENCSQIQPNGI